MKSNLLRKSGLGLLIVAGALVPMASSAEEGSKYGHQATGTAMERGDQGAIRTESMSADHALSDSVLFPDLQNVQFSKGWSATERGAQGPVRTESLDTSPSYKTGDMYFDLKNIHFSTGGSATERGAQGPVRTERMDTSPSYRGGDMYFDLKNIQSSR